MCQTAMWYCQCCACATINGTSQTLFTDLQNDLAAANDRAANAKSSKAEVNEPKGSIKSLKAELADQKAKLEAQQPQLQAAAELRTQLSELQKQLEEQKKKTEGQDKQLEDMAALRTQLTEVGLPLMLMLTQSTARPSRHCSDFVTLGQSTSASLIDLQSCRTPCNACTLYFKRQLCAWLGAMCCHAMSSWELVFL